MGGRFQVVEEQIMDLSAIGAGEGGAKGEFGGGAWARACDETLSGGIEELAGM